MKTLFLKNRMPVATAVLAIAGAFATTSMQSSSSAFALKIGYVLERNGECDITVACADVVGPQVCRLSYPAGDRAFGKNPHRGDCTNILWRAVQP